MKARIRKFAALVPPLGMARIVIGLLALVAAFALVNLAYHVYRKPTEMFYPVDSVLKKQPAETWRTYSSLFQRYSTAVVSPELLAALAQVEAAGNPVARTYWRWRLTWHPFEIYQPASSAVGMYQMTDGAFEEARQYCIRKHAVAAQGSCWMTSLYTRVLPSHAVELTAIYLDRHASRILEGLSARATPQQRQDLAAVVHLCGSGPAETFAQRGFRPATDQYCGDHDVAGYLARVNAMKRRFLGFSSVSATAG